MNTTVEIIPTIIFLATLRTGRSFILLSFQKTVCTKPANGWRYPQRVGGTRERHFDGINSKPHKQLENAATPTRRVLAWKRDPP
jgi:hypothetical protein